MARLSAAELHGLPCVHDVQDDARVQALGIFNELTGKAAVGVWGVYAFSAEVVELLEVSVHHDLFLVTAEKYHASGSSSALLAGGGRRTST